MLQRGRKCHGLYRNMLGYVGTSDEENINVLDLVESSPFSMAGKILFVQERARFI